MNDSEKLEENLYKNVKDYINLLFSQIKNQITDVQNTVSRKLEKIKESEDIKIQTIKNNYEELLANEKKLNQQLLEENLKVVTEFQKINKDFKDNYTLLKAEIYSDLIKELLNDDNFLNGVTDHLLSTLDI